MFSRIYTKIVLSTLVVSFLVPSGLLLYPKRAQAAGTDCAAVIGAVTTAIITLSAPQKVTGVTTTNTAQETAQAQTTGTSYGTFFKDCVLTPIAIRMAKAMLQNITQSTVDWINNGFKDSKGRSTPSFVTDLRGLMNDTTDQAIGEFLEKDLRAGFLCSPFALQVRIAVAQTYLPYRQKSSCTLTQITNNVNGFLKTDNIGGWNNWIQVTTVPQNNVFGATVLAQDALTMSIATKLGIQNRELDWGKGFRSWKSCETQAEADARDPGGGATPVCTTKTPGSVVEAQLEISLGSGVKQLEVADDINAILNALENQLMLKVMKGAQGLLGAGRSTNGSYNPATYETAIEGTVTDVNLATAINTGISDTSNAAGLDILFSTEVGTGTPTVATATGNVVVDEDGNPIQVDSLSWSVESITSYVSTSTPLVYDIGLETNYQAKNLTVRTTLTKGGVTMPFLSVFSSFQISYGRADVGTAIKYIESPADASATWSGVSASPTFKFNFGFFGTKKLGAPAGVYTIETSVSDSTGVLEVNTDTFNIQ